MFVQIFWNDIDNDGNVAHLAINGVTKEEFEEIFFDDRIPTAVSNSSPYNPIKQGHTSTGKFIQIIWREVDDDPRGIEPVTAFPIDKLDEMLSGYPRRRRKKRGPR